MLTIAFDSNLNYHQEIFIIDSDGSNLRQLTNRDVLSWWPSWSPDGNFLTFASFVMGSAEVHDIFIIRSSGIGEVKILGTNADEWFPAWRPEL